MANTNLELVATFQNLDDLEALVLRLEAAEQKTEKYLREFIDSYVKHFAIQEESEEGIDLFLNRWLESERVPLKVVGIT